MLTKAERLNYETQAHLLHLKDVLGAMRDEIEKDDPKFLEGLLEAAREFTARALDTSEIVELQLRKAGK